MSHLLRAACVGAVVLTGGGVVSQAACSNANKANLDGGHPDGSLASSDATVRQGEAAPSDTGSLPNEASAGSGASVLEHHLHPSRDGFYIDANVTATAAASLKVEAGFQATVTGIIYGQALYVDSWKTGQDALFVATDQNHVTALDATSGSVLWDKTLGSPVPLGDLACGQPYPTYGVMETPTIDLTTRTLYVESFQTPDGGTTKKHYVYALSIDDGSTRTGWPVDVAATVPGFDAAFQNDRGALALVQGTLYVPYAGLNGDCGTYHGWVVSISTTSPTTVSAYSTAASRGGIWGAVTSDGTSAFAVTGNTAIGTTVWAGGEALLRLNAGGAFSGQSTDYFTPSNWQTLDLGDSDLGSSASVFIDVPGATPSTLAIAGGKFGVIHLLNRANLGGVGTGDGQNGEGLFSMSITGNQLKGTPAAYTSTMGQYVVLRSTFGAMTACPAGSSGDMMALRVTATSPPKLVPAWCVSSQPASMFEGGAAIATTTDGRSNALVWIVGVGTHRLLAFDGDTGAPVFPAGMEPQLMGPVEHWVSPIVAKGRFFVAGENAVYAFTTL
jgi:hypothetical protein